MRTLLMALILTSCLTAQAISGGSYVSSKELIYKTTVRVVMEDEDQDGNLTRHFCTGVIIGRTTVLTAAHCAANYLGQKVPAENIQIENKFGGLFGSGFFSVSLKVQAIELHPSWSGISYDSDNESNDIAVLLMEKEFGPEYQTAEIMTEYNRTKMSNPETAGYGAISNAKPDATANLKKGKLSIDFATLNQPSDPSELLTYTQSHRADANCRGDSGGPLYVVENNQIQVFALHVATHYSSQRTDLSCPTSEDDLQYAALLFQSNRDFVKKTWLKWHILR